MRILKKVIRKLYHLIWFLGAFLLFSPYVNAAPGIVNIDGAAFETASFANFGDLTNGRMTIVGATFNDYGSYYRSNSSLYTNGANIDGANLIFDANQTFVSGYTYVVSVIIGFANGYPKASTNRVCVAENQPNVITRWNDQNSFPCPSALYITNTTNVATFTDGNGSYSYGLLNYVFTSNVTGTAIALAYNSSVANESNHTFGGYRVTLLSDNKQLTQQQVTQAVQSSGLATAQSVTQVQQSVTQVQQELGSIDNTLNDSSVDSSDNTINNLKNQIPTNSVISDLLLLPIRFLQNFVNALNSSCSTFSLGSLLGTNLFMPCINLENYLGSTIWTMIDLIFSGMFVYGLRKKFIQIYQNLTNLKNGGNEVD